jgi:hypothetical protein
MSTDCTIPETRKRLNLHLYWHTSPCAETQAMRYDSSTHSRRIIAEASLRHNVTPFHEKPIHLRHRQDYWPTQSKPRLFPPIMSYRKTRRAWCPRLLLMILLAPTLLWHAYRRRRIMAFLYVWKLSSLSNWMVSWMGTNGAAASINRNVWSIVIRVVD